MNKKKCLELKRIIGYNEDTPTLKKHYKRLKKQYQKLSPEAKPLFLEKLRETYNKYLLDKLQNYTHENYTAG